MVREGKNVRMVKTRQKSYQITKTGVKRHLTRSENVDVNFDSGFLYNNSGGSVLLAEHSRNLSILEQNQIIGISLVKLICALFYKFMREIQASNSTV